MRFFSEAMNYPWVKIVLGLLVVGMLAANARTRKTVVQTLFAVAVANGLTDIFKNVWPMHRPFQDFPGPHNVIMWVGQTANPGTASAHSANMAAVAFVFVYHLRWWGSPWVFVAVVTGISRVFCGAHYPYQVLLGATCGLTAALAVTKGWEWFVARRAPKGDRE